MGPVLRMVFDSCACGGASAIFYFRYQFGDHKMDVGVLIVEKLDSNGFIRTFRMKSSWGDEITVAFPSEYDEPRTAPLHFLHEVHSRRFREGFAECDARKLGDSKYRKLGNIYKFNTSWINIPTERERMSLYVLSLPENAIPQSVLFYDPRNGREYKEWIEKDDRERRYFLYLPCRSKHGSFDFGLTVRFQVDADSFTESRFDNGNGSREGPSFDIYKYILSGEQSEAVTQFLAGNIKMGDTYNVQQAGAVGPSSEARDFSMDYREGWTDSDLECLATELSAIANKLAEDQTAESSFEVDCLRTSAEFFRSGDMINGSSWLRHAASKALHVAIDIGADMAKRAITRLFG